MPALLPPLRSSETPNKQANTPNPCLGFMFGWCQLKAWVTEFLTKPHGRHKAKPPASGAPLGNLLGEESTWTWRSQGK